LDITLDKKNSTEAFIKVKLKESDYQPNVEQKVKEYAKKANIKGFRPGKVPPGMIRKMYGKSIIVEEVNSILSKSLQEYIRENNIQLIGEPLPDMEKAQKIDWDNQKEFEFDYEVGLVDEFSYDLSPKQKVKSYQIELDKKTINETLDNVKKQFGNSINPEESKEGDSFYGKLEQVDGDLSKEGVINWDDLNKKEHKKFKGIKPGTEIELDVQKAFQDHHVIAHLLDVGHEKAKELKGKFKFTLEKINRTEPAEINQELFDKVFGKDAIKTEEEFIEKVKSTVEENYNRETDYLLDRDIKDHFTEKVKMDIPEKFLKNWLLQSNEGKVTEEDIEKEFDQYVKQLKWDLIKNKIAEDEEIKVENEEVVNKAKSMILQQLGGQGMADQMKDHLDTFADNYLKGENGQNYMKVFGEVRDEKILAHIKDIITITGKKVSADEFKKLATA